MRGAGDGEGAVDGLGTLEAGADVPQALSRQASRSEIERRTPQIRRAALVSCGRDLFGSGYFQTAYW
jgi:hypothetical protein